MINSLVIKMHQSIIYLHLAPLWISLGALRVFCVKCKVGAANKAQMLRMAPSQLSRHARPVRNQCVTL